MADILIRGMDMPTEQRVEVLIFKNGFVAYYDVYGRYIGQAKATPLPAGHGRLIDADAIEYTYTTARGNDDGHNWRIFAVGQDEVDDMPTIVPAEGGNADG